MVMHMAEFGRSSERRVGISVLRTLGTYFGWAFLAADPPRLVRQKKTGKGGILMICSIFGSRENLVFFFL